MIWGIPIFRNPLTKQLLSGMYSQAETVWHVWRLLVLLVIMPPLWGVTQDGTTVQGVSCMICSSKDYPKRGDPRKYRHIIVNDRQIFASRLYSLHILVRVEGAVERIYS